MPRLTRRPLTRLLLSSSFRVLRIFALFACSIWLMIPVATSLVAYAQGQRSSSSLPSDLASRQYLQNIENEHRFSVLETKLDGVSDRVAFMQTSMWGLIVGMSGLLGERGVTLVRGFTRRKGQGQGQGDQENENNG